LDDASSLSSRASIEVQLRGVSLPSGCDHARVRWYLRYGLSYRDVEELLAARPRTRTRRSSCGTSSAGKSRRPRRRTRTWRWALCSMSG